jgi:hypothetical protein
MIAAECVLRSSSPGSPDIATIVATYPRFIHAELLTHRVFSRNSSSSRAIPSHRYGGDGTAMPVWWGKNQPGMSADIELCGWRRTLAATSWRTFALLGRLQTRWLAWLGLHKQLANRWSETGGHITTIITATDWCGFLEQRTHSSAQPEMRELAGAIRRELRLAPTQELDAGGWHTPFHADVMVSAGRCARISYRGHHRPRTEDADLAHKLLNPPRGGPPHMSPFEHQATPAVGRWANLQGWRSYRSVMGR